VAIALDRGSDRSKGCVRDAAGTNDTAFPSRAGDPATGSGNDRKGAWIGIGNTSRCHPSHTTGHTGHVPGGPTRLSLDRNMKSRKTERIEVVVAQGLLDRGVESAPAAVTRARTLLDLEPSTPYPRA